MNSLEIFEKIERLRKNKNLTVYALCKESTVSHSTFYNWQKRKTLPTIEVLEKLCDTLCISLPYLLFDNENSFITHEQKTFLELLAQLNMEQRNIILSTMKNMVR